MSDLHNYSRIIDSGLNLKIKNPPINSSSIKDTSPIKRKWSPEMSSEEHSIIKQQREQIYLQKIDEKNRPILQIQNKTVFKDLALPDGFRNLQTNEKFFKSTSDSKPLDSSPNNLKSTKPTISKPIILAQANTNSLSKETITKIHGREILPKGFLELDPILNKSSYEFESKTHERQFEEEQKKKKMQRMKQYELRNIPKERKVTIFVVEEQKNQILLCLDNWFKQTKRLMNSSELEYVAKTLQTEPDLLNRIQEAYFSKLKAIDNKRFEKDFVRNNEISKLTGEVVPDHIKKYFLTNPSDLFQNTDPKINLPEKSYNQVYLNKYAKRLHTRKLAPTHKIKNAASSLPGKSFDEHLNLLSDKFNLALQNSEQLKNPENLDSLKIEHKIDEEFTKQKTPISNHFDKEINAILKKMLESQSLEKPNPEKPEINSKSDFLNAHSIKIEDVWAEYSRNPDVFKRDQPLLLSQVISPLEILDKNWLDIPVFSPQKESFNLQKLQSEKLNTSVLKPTKKTNNPFRNTTIFKDEKGKSIMIQKIKPLFFRNEYFFQTIIDTVDHSNIRSVVLITRRQNGEILSEERIDPNLAGNFYESYLVEELDTNETYLFLRNELKVNCAKTLISQHQDFLNLKLVKVFENKGYCVDGVNLEQLPDNETRKTHRLRPILVGGEFYRQQVVDIIEKNNKKALTVFTFNERNTQISEIKANANFIETSDFVEIESDQIDFEGNRSIVVVTKNDLNQIIARQTFNSNIDSQLSEQNCNQILEEVEFEEGEKQLTISFKNSRGILQVTRKLIGLNF